MSDDRVTWLSNRDLNTIANLAESIREEAECLGPTGHGVDWTAAELEMIVTDLTDLEIAFTTARGELADALCRCPYMLPSRHATEPEDHEAECPFRLAVERRARYRDRREERIPMRRPNIEEKKQFEDMSRALEANIIVGANWIEEQLEADPSNQAAKTLRGILEAFGLANREAIATHDKIGVDYRATEIRALAGVITDLAFLRKRAERRLRDLDTEISRMHRVFAVENPAGHIAEIVGVLRDRRGHAAESGEVEDITDANVTICVERVLDVADLADTLVEILSGAKVPDDIIEHTHDPHGAIAKLRDLLESEPATLLEVHRAFDTLGLQPCFSVAARARLAVDQVEAAKAVLGKLLKGIPGTKPDDKTTTEFAIEALEETLRQRREDSEVTRAIDATIDRMIGAVDWRPLRPDNSRMSDPEIVEHLAATFVGATGWLDRLIDIAGPLAQALKGTERDIVQRVALVMSDIQVWRRDFFGASSEEPMT